MRPAVIRCTHCRSFGWAQPPAPLREKRRYSTATTQPNGQEVAQHALPVLGSMYIIQSTSEFLPAGLPVLPSKLITDHSIRPEAAPCTRLTDSECGANTNT